MRLYGIAEESCWRCGSWGHTPTTCPRYLSGERLAERWRERYGTNPPWLWANALNPGPTSERRVDA